MKVAIIGAGLAGLSCAHELERYGIKPVIYERNSFIGEAFPHVGATLEVMVRPVRDTIRFFKEKLHIDISPLNTVNRILHYSPNKTSEIRGNLGYFLERGKGPEDIKVQLLSSLKNTEISFNTAGEYKLLAGEYDSVVIANGEPLYTRELGCWIDWVDTYVRGAVVLGDFDPNTLIVWLNRDYCKYGYAYLNPYNSKRASLNLVVTDVELEEVDKYWELFLYTENIKYVLAEEYKIKHVSGHVYPHRVGNLYFAGNAGGMIDPFLGFGVESSIVSGVMAARSIMENRDYEKLLNTVVKKNLQLYEFRKAFNNMENPSLDMVVQAVGLPGVRHVMYHSPVNVVKYGAYLIQLRSKFTR